MISAREYAFEITEPFDFDRIAAGIEEEHCALLAWFASKANHRRNVEFDFSGLEAVRQCKPVIEWEHDAEMRHHHHMIAYLTGSGNGERRAEMQ